MDKSDMIQKYLKPAALLIISFLLYYCNYNQVGIIVFLIFLIDNFYTLNYYWKRDKDNSIIISEIDKGISNNLSNIPYPIAIMNKQGDIIWGNDRLFEISKKEEIINKNILSIVRELDIDKLIKEDKVSNERVKIKEKKYYINSTKIKNENNIFYLLHFFDASNIMGLDKAKESVIHLEVDNLSEVLETTDEGERPLLVAEVERCINTYAHKLNAMIKKYDTNKYILSSNDSEIDKEIEEGFKILENISAINKGNKMEITLSIGVGRGGITPQENDKFATVAKELALGRGGDQVVIKDNENIKIIGGNTKEIEKRTRVRARVISHALKELIYESNKVFIMGHSNPDMDCFGSAVALASTIRVLGKECNIILGNDNNPIRYFLDRLKKDEKYNSYFISLDEANKKLDDNTLVILVDVHNKSYVYDVDFIEKSKRKVIIDHHRRSPDMVTGALLNYIEVYASSTSEMITEMIQYILKNPKLNELEAEGLLSGIYMDTKGFSFKTGVRTFEAASFLRNVGADTIEVKKMFTDDLESYLLIAETIKSAEVNADNNIAIAVCPKNIDTVIVAKAADELLNISGISASFVLGNINGEIYISGRSVGDINVQVIMEELGGGGHMNIAGAKISNMPIEEVIIKLKESITKHLRMGD